MGNKIYICDDEEGMRRYLRKMLSNWGHDVEVYSSPLDLLRALNEAEGAGNLILLDIKMPEMDGIEALKKIRGIQAKIPVIMMTGHGTIESAVEAMKIGAYDYLTKPFPQEKLFALVQHALDQEKLLYENRQLKKELQEKRGPAKPVFVSERFRQLYDLTLRVAASDSNVLVLGESGTGKELIAGTIHEHSPRAEKRFVAVNCAALSETLLESQLFGHVRGAFTGAIQAQKGLLEEADGGTLFLDEIGDISPVLQAKLLRVLQEGEFLPVGSTRARRVDVRFVAATNKNLEHEVEKGAFREDLYYRLNVISLDLPPLRERCEDIVPLAQHFLAHFSRKSGRTLKGFAKEAQAALMHYRWPGNVRELENAVERGVILAAGDLIRVEDLPLKVHEEKSDTSAVQEGEVLSLREAERIQVVRALKQTNWNKSRASQILGVTRKTLDRKIREFELVTASGGSAD